MSSPFACYETKVDMQMIKVILIMAPERRLSLLQALESSGMDVLPVCDCSEARRVLEAEPQVQVVLTDRALPDGDWREAFQVTAEVRPSVQVVVCSRLGDHTLIIDVLEQGAYDVLSSLTRAKRYSEFSTVLQPEATCAHCLPSKQPTIKQRQHPPLLRRSWNEKLR